MHLHRSPSGVVVHAPAKLNLFFEVLGKRADGYHEIETLVLPIDWYDTLFFQDDPCGAISLRCLQPSSARGPRGTEAGDIPEGDENLVVRAARLLRQRAGVTCGARMRLVKRIPSAAGLGGGSSDAAATLLAANAVWRLGWSREQLAEVGAALGSDVPLFLAHGASVCRGRGERVESLGGLGGLHFVVVRPPVGLSTAAVYQRCEPAGAPRPLQPLLEGLQRGQLQQVGRGMFNRLEAAAESLSPWIARLRQELADLECLGYQMSGSGSCYFGLCRHARHARRVARRLEARGVGIALAVRGSV